MRIFTGEISGKELAVVSAATVALLTGCAAQAAENNATNEVALVTPSPTSTTELGVVAPPQSSPNPDIIPATPQATVTLDTKALQTEKAVAPKSASAIGEIVVDNCNGAATTLPGKETTKSFSIIDVDTNLGKIMYGDDYNPNGPSTLECRQTSIPAETLLASLVLTVERKVIEPNSFHDGYVDPKETIVEKGQTPPNYTAELLDGSLMLKNGSAVSFVTCAATSKTLMEDPICKDNKISPEEVLRSSIAMSPLRATMAISIVEIESRRGANTKEAGDIATISFEKLIK